MVMSVNTNVGAMIALQNLAITNKMLINTQLRVTTGLRVSRTRFPWTQNWLNRSVQGGPEHDRQF